MSMLAERSLLIDESERPRPTAWTRACRYSDLEPGWGEAVILGGRQIALVLVAGAVDEVYATDHRDPFTGAFVMARGIVGSKGEHMTIASPLHKQIYDIASGECLSADGPRIDVFGTRIVDGWIEVELPTAC